MEKFIKEFNTIANKYRIHTVILCVGIAVDKIHMEEAVLVSGHQECMTGLLGTCMRQSEQLRTAIDDNVIAVQIKKNEKKERVRN